MHGHVKFQGKGTIKYFYYPMLITHVILAVTIVPMIIMTLIPAFLQAGCFDKHKRIALRWTPLPLIGWLYVSVTGVLIYLMCYIWYA